MLRRIVLVEGQSLLRDLLARILREDARFELVGELDEAATAVEICRRARPDLLIADVCLPQGDAMQLLEYVRTKLTNIRVLVLSHCSDGVTLQRLRQIGIHGFVEKEQSLEIVEEAIEEVASGRQYFTAAWSRAEASFESGPGAVTGLLNARERDILRLVALGQTNKSIAFELGLSLRSVETYRYRMMRKLGLKTTASLIELGVRRRLISAAP
jgi:DNA-binding NarL/FixJ family response regulator